MKFFLKLGFVGLLFSQGFWGNEWPMPKIEYKPKTYVCIKHPLQSKWTGN